MNSSTPLIARLSHSGLSHSGLSRSGLLAIFLLSVSLTGLSVPQWCLGQGTQADYQRMEDQRELGNQLVDRRTLDIHWLSEDKAMWYRVQASPEVTEYHLVIPGQSAESALGENLLLFTNVQLQDWLSEREAAPKDQRSLRTLSLLFGDSLESAYFQLDNTAYRFGIPDASFEPVPTDELPVVPPAAEVEVRPSGDSTQRIHVQFENKRSEPIQLFWVDSQLRAQPYQKLEPGESATQNTFASHRWLVRSEEGKNLVFIEAQIDGQKVEVTEESSVKLTVTGRNRRQGQFYLAGNQDREENWQGRRPRRNGSARSPDGKWRATVRDYNVFLEAEVDTDESEQQDRQITDDGKEQLFYNNQFFWSPDSQFLVVMQEKPAQSHPVHFVESSPKDQLQPKLHTFEYLKPGDDIRLLQPKLYAIESGKILPIDNEMFSNPWSLSDMHWLDDSSEFLFRYNQRGHQAMRVIGINRQGQTRAVVDETVETFIHYTQKTFVEYLEDSDEIVWASERDGWNHLYLYDLPSGNVKNQITRGPWVVRQVLNVDPENQQIKFTASGIYPAQDPYQIHYGQVNFDGTELMWLTEGDGNHSIDYSPEKKYFVDSYSRMDLPPVHELRDSTTGKLICKLESANWERLLDAGWQPPEPFVAKGRDAETDIYGVIYRPQNFDPEKVYPVIEYIYAGPHDSFVPKTFSPTRAEKSLAELGFIVVQIDGMGTSNRSKAFHDVCWKNLGDSGFPDRISWLRAAAEKYPYMDLERVGIYGGSAGGQSSTRAVLAFGDFYDVAVSDCGCHDNRMDKIWWNEQWMGWPIGDHYEEQSNVTQAHQLQGKLMLMVGEMDRNVDPASTMQVVDALIKADKDFELLVFPGGGHGSGFGKYGRRRMCDFFVRHLLGVEPRVN